VEPFLPQAISGGSAGSNGSWLANRHRRNEPKLRELEYIHGAGGEERDGCE
jgi:hypothetical protein